MSLITKHQRCAMTTVWTKFTLIITISPIKDQVLLHHFQNLPVHDISEKCCSCQSKSAGVKLSTILQGLHSCVMVACSHPYSTITRYLLSFSYPYLFEPENLGSLTAQTDRAHGGYGTILNNMSAQSKN